ncbi:MAG: DNA (cytosine-5-)-methyltransferase [Alistipes sp.]|nr:DNA (cytosine-5-)-methyltransferase [Alistipes sp.]
MTHASLFSGIGGFDLAAEWAGWTNMFNCEIDPFCRPVLAYHFPNAVQYEDIRTTDFTVWRGRIDVLTGGFPCQPFSVAGKRKGTDDDRYLWPEMLRAIREIRPRWVVGENVRGFVNWSEGMVLDTVFADLEALGYEVQPFVLPACAVGAPHRRDRVWIVAHRSDAGSESLRERQEPADSPEAATDTSCLGLPYGDSGRVRRCENRFSENELTESPNGTEFWKEYPTQSPVRSGDDGLPAELDGITFPAWRRQSIKAYGNAIVPQVFYQIAETINKYENKDLL